MNYTLSYTTSAKLSVYLDSSWAQILMTNFYAREHLKLLHKHSSPGAASRLQLLDTDENISQLRTRLQRSPLDLPDCITDPNKTLILTTCTSSLILS